MKAIGLAGVFCRMISQSGRHDLLHGYRIRNLCFEAGAYSARNAARDIYADSNPKGCVEPTRAGEMVMMCCR